MSTITNILSYPPVFRPTRKPDPMNHHPTNPINDPDPIPVIDMAHFDTANLHVACSDWGIFRVINHGISDELIARLMESAKSSFDLPFETKQEIFTKPNPVYTWGSKAFNPKSPDGSPEVGIELLDLSRAPPSHFEDGGEPAVISFRHAMDEYGEHMITLARKLFKAMAVNLKLDLDLAVEGNLDKYLDDSDRILRAHRYPPHAMGDTSTQIIGFPAHSDNSMLSIILEDDVQGLELHRDDGLWVPVKPVTNTLLVNVGDMLKAMSNDKYKSAEHRVTLNKHQERISFCYFVFPEENTVITSSRSKYRPFTHKEFRAQVKDDFAKYGIKVGLSRFLALNVTKTEYIM